MEMPAGAEAHTDIAAFAARLKAGPCYKAHPKSSFFRSLIAFDCSTADCSTADCSTAK
jgi:hypothetical protein